MKKLLITGAAGTIGQAITKHLEGDYHLTLVDRNFDDYPENLALDAVKIAIDLDNSEAWEDLLEDIEYIVHLAGNPDAFAKFEEVWQPNFIIPKLLFEYAEQASKLKRIVFASSVHAVDGYPEGKEIQVNDPTRPDGYYGISKLYMESVANYYAYQKGIEAIGIRIGNYSTTGSKFSKEINLHGLAEIITENDFNHLLDCCLNTELSEPFLIVNGISNNSFNRLEIESLKTLIGYEPKDNAFDMAEVEIQKNEPTV